MEWLMGADAVLSCSVDVSFVFIISMTQGSSSEGNAGTDSEGARQCRFSNRKGRTNHQVSDPTLPRFLMLRGAVAIRCRTLSGDLSAVKMSSDFQPHEKYCLISLMLLDSIHFNRTIFGWTNVWSLKYVSQMSIR